MCVSSFSLFTNKLSQYLQSTVLKKKYYGELKVVFGTKKGYYLWIEAETGGALVVASEGGGNANSLAEYIVDSVF